QLPGVAAEAIEQVPLAISHEATEAWPGEIGAEVVEDIWPPSGRDPYLERVSGAAAYALSPSLAFGEDDDTGGGQARSAGWTRRRRRTHRRPPRVRPAANWALVRSVTAGTALIVILLSLVILTAANREPTVGRAIGPAA